MLILYAYLGVEYQTTLAINFGICWGLVGAAQHRLDAGQHFRETYATIKYRLKAQKSTGVVKIRGSLMESNELATFNQAIKYAQSGYNEKAFEFIKILAQIDPDNIDLIFWGMYTAPNFEWAQSLFERARRVDPDHRALPQAEQWLINEKLSLPHPAMGYSLFPPNINTVQIGTNSNRHSTPAQPAYWTQPVQMQYQSPPPAQMYYQAPQPQFYPPHVPVMPQQIYIQNGPVYAYSCRYCHSYIPPRTGRRTSTGGWIVFALLVFLFFPLCWIGLLFKENYRVCGQCGIKAN